MFHYLLGINVRPQNVQDFAEISARLAHAAPDIAILGRPGDLAQCVSQARFPELPSLFLYLVNPPLYLQRTGTTISVEKIGKLREYDTFVQAGVRTPATTSMQKGLVVQESDWGAHIIIKPSGESFGRGVALVETQQLNALIQQNGAYLDELISKGYLVQRYVDSGAYQEKYRVIVFLGHVILCYKVVYRKAQSLPKYSSIPEAIQDNYFLSDSKLKYQLVKNDEIERFAVEAYQANPQCPLQGLDIQRSTNGDLYVIENNAGGNVWKFSDTKSSPYKVFGPKRMIEQYNAWDVCAKALAETTYQMAS